MQTMTEADALLAIAVNKAMGAGAPKLVLDEAQVRKAKEQRFDLSAKILAGNKVKAVQVVNEPYFQANADYNTGTKVLRLNEAYPVKIKDEVQELIFDRGKLYHEIGHALFTAQQTKRGHYMAKSKSPDTFLTVSGLLEDGRIENKMIEKYQGTQPFFDALLGASTDAKSMDVLNGLALRVRKGFWRNEEESAFWAPFEKQIDKAVKADHTNGVLQTAFDIVEAMDLPPQPKQPQEPTEPDPTDEPTDEPTEGEIELGGGGTENGDGTDSGTGKGEEPTPSEKVKDIVEKAIQQLRSEAEKEWNGILEQVQSDPVQELASATEVAAKDQLVPILRNVLTEAARTKEYGSREGIINTLSLHNILTSKRVFKTKVEGKGAPHVALLLDASGSMGRQADALGQSARILNGALREVGIPTKIIAFGFGEDDGITEYPTVPLSGFGAHGGTPTGFALAAANQWFEDEQAQRPLAIIVTDGGPNDIDQLIREKEKTNDLNGFVIGVHLESKQHLEHYLKHDPDYLKMRDQMFNAHDRLDHPKDLPALLEPLITDYINS
jgi:uncharacterized protein YegL